LPANMSDNARMDFFLKQKENIHNSR
ncbi:hypothetical protein SAMN03159353_11171, partial [Cedecea sp. NFIX57]